MTLKFDGHGLVGSGTRAAMIYPAVSGKPIGPAEFDYSPERQKIAFQGPIPEGAYWIQPSQLWRNNWAKSMLRTPRSAWGNYRLAIHPYPTTVTHGRGGFFIHGGSIPGSAGCIDLTSQMDRFIQDLIHELDGTPECFIPLTVRYHRTERKGR
ncbi:MAG: DUF2778 domain-containing protein [Aquabacterium sp.]|nr:DUF2778 domain-containing protein [Aquabacterium sp.]